MSVTCLGRSWLMTRTSLLAALALATFSADAWAQAAAQSRYGRADRRDAIFLRFPEMSDRYWVNTETMAASHKSVAVPLPRQCAFVYADAYTRGAMSEREVQETALSNCNRKLAELAPLGDNYGANCHSKDAPTHQPYLLPPPTIPDQPSRPT